MHKQTATDKEEDKNKLGNRLPLVPKGFDKGRLGAAAPQENETHIEKSNVNTHKCTNRPQLTKKKTRASLAIGCLLCLKASKRGASGAAAPQEKTKHI